MTNKEAILDETFLLFAKDGEHFSLSHLAQTLGIKKQSLYNYFNKKDDLLVDMLTREIESYYRAIDESIAGHETLALKERLYHMGLVFLDNNKDKNRVKVRQSLSRIIDQDNMVAIKAMISHHKEKYQEYFQGLLEEAKRLDLVKHQALDFMNAFFFTFVRGLIDGLMSSNPYPSHQAFYDKFFQEYWTLLSQ